MGVRDRAIEAQEQEESGYSRGSLFGKTESFEDREYYTPPRPHSYGGYEDVVPGTIKMELIVPISELGEFGDPDSPKFDYNKMLNDAEIAAMEQIEEFGGRDVLERYEVGFSSEESVDCIEVCATLKPITKSKV